MTRAKFVYPLVEFEVNRSVQMIGGHLMLRCRALAERHEQMRMLVAREHDRHRALHVTEACIEQRPTGAGRVRHVAVQQQHERLDTLLGHRGVQAGADIAIHACRDSALRESMSSVVMTALGSS